MRGFIKNFCDIDTINPNEETIITLINLLENYNFKIKCLSNYVIYYSDYEGYLVIEALDLYGNDIAEDIIKYLNRFYNITIRWNFWDTFYTHSICKYKILYKKIYKL